MVNFNQNQLLSMIPSASTLFNTESTKAIAKCTTFKVNLLHRIAVTLTVKWSYLQTNKVLSKKLCCKPFINTRIASSLFELISEGICPLTFGKLWEVPIG